MRLFIVSLSMLGLSAQLATAAGYPLAPVPFNEVTLRDEFWLPRLTQQAETTLPHALKETQPAVDNLRKCAAFLRGEKDDLPFVHRFISSDLYKVMEGGAYLLTIKRDPELEKQMDEIIDIIAAAQRDDGYLYVSHITGVSKDDVTGMGETPYSYVVHSHELYNMGHMYEGAVAYYRATGKDKWLQVAEKSARHINKVFFEGDPNYNDGKPVNQAPGHEELELALCKLYELTGERLYLDMAKRFLDIRGVTYVPEGTGTLSPEYAQQHEPVAEQRRAVGHAVRAAYLYAGMADVDAMTGRADYTKALDSIWHNIVDTKMHINGGLGAVHGIEGFGPEYELPNKDTYNETCAAVANFFFNYRMFLLHQDAKYVDVAEVALFNNSLAGVNLEGNKFFYVNPLEADGVKPFNHGTKSRSDWFGCACCPSNIARLMPQVSGYMYAHTDNAVFVTLYAGNRTTVELAGGEVGLEQQTKYPFDEDIRLIVNPKQAQQFALNLRIPTWARERFVPGELYDCHYPVTEKWQVRVNGERVQVDLDKGFVSLDRAWMPGDVVELHLPMPVQYNTSIPQVKDNIGRVAVTRGPLVYCAEEVDNGGRVQRLFLDRIPAQADAVVLPITDGTLKGVMAVDMPARELPDNPVTMRLIPYFAWSNRGDLSMNVWFPTTAAAAEESIQGGIQRMESFGRVEATHCWEYDSVRALFDARHAANSFDTSIPRWTSWEQKGKDQAITITFSAPRAVRSLGVYWYDDNGGVQVPVEWSMRYMKDGEWRLFEKYVTDAFSTFKDKYNVVHPAEELVCDGLQILMTPRKGACVGILDVDLEFE